MLRTLLISTNTQLPSLSQGLSDTYYSAHSLRQIHTRDDSVCLRPLRGLAEAKFQGDIRNSLGQRAAWVPPLRDFAHVNDREPYSPYTTSLAKAT